jgi:2-dehydropantoate 2-reductase
MERRRRSKKASRPLYLRGKSARDKILLVGSGALATLFAYRLAAAGVEVTLLGTWAEGLAALRENGAQLDGAGSFPVRTIDNPADCREAKFALVLVKSWQTERAAHQLADCLAKDGLAVTLQNGLGNDTVLSEILGLQRVVRGVTTFGATLLAPGLVRSGGEGAVVLEAQPRLAPLKKLLRVANLATKTVTNIESVIWGKIVVNAAINPLTALLRVKNGELLERPSVRALMGELACETAAVAETLGVALPFSGPERAAEEVARRTAENTSSMLQDVLRGAPTEIDAINGAVIHWGEKKNVPTPVNRVMWSLVKALPVRGKI